ncbi:MAG: glycosyltransferase [Cyclobacteriaceae bacterium]
MRKIKVLEVIRQGLIGGGESHVIDVVKFLDRSIFEPYVISFTDGPMISELEDMDVKSHIIPTQKAFDTHIWSKISKFIDENEIDLIHAHGSRAQSNVFWSARKKRKPLIYTVHGWSFHDDQKVFAQKVRVISEKFMVNMADMVINVSRSNQQTGLKKIGKYNNRVINNGIDLNKFSSKVSASELKATLQIPKDAIVVGCIMRMTKQKNPMSMLRAFRQANQQVGNLHLLLVGDGELMPQIKAYIDKHSLESNVTLTGNRKDIPQLLSMIDIYCLPSLWEGLPLSLLEAMAMRKAIIATRVDGTKELIQEGVNGLIIEPNDTKSLAEKVVFLSKQKEIRTEYGRLAESLIIRDHSVTKMVKEIEEVYFSLLNKKFEND